MKNYFLKLEKLLGKRAPRTVILAFLVFFTPFVIHVIAFVWHALLYNGICGPHATDIPAYPCNFKVYLKDFYGGFNGLVIMMFSLFSTFFVFIISVISWIILDKIFIKSNQKKAKR